MPPYSAISVQKGLKLNFMKYKNDFLCLLVEGCFYPDLSLNIRVVVHVNSRQREPFSQPFRTLRQTPPVKYHSSNEIIESVETKDNAWKSLNQLILRWTCDSTLWGLKWLNGNCDLPILFTGKIGFESLGLGFTQKKKKKKGNGFFGNIWAGQWSSAPLPNLSAFWALYIMKPGLTLFLTRSCPHRKHRLIG